MVTDGSEASLRRPDRAERIRDLLARYEGPLVRYAMHFTGDIERARDVVQETFLRLCRQPGAVRDHVVPWLFRVCRNQAVDVRRKENRMASIEEVQSSEPSSSEPGSLQLLERKERLGEVLGALAALPPKQQEVIRLKFQNGLSYREISRVTQLSVSNVGFLIHTGLKAIRRSVAKQENAGSGVARRTK